MGLGTSHMGVITTANFIPTTLIWGCKTCSE